MVTTQHIGAAGELLVQYQFLKHNIDSARLTTDSGVDLVVYSPSTTAATTVQVKTILAPKPAGGRGPLANDWWFPHACPADMLALVRLSTDSVWLFTLDEARELAQQHNDKGNHHLYWLLAATERGHEASLIVGMVRGWEWPRRGVGGAGGCPGCRGGAQSVAVVSAMALRAADSSTMCLLVV